MVTVKNEEREVLGYLKEALNHNKLNGVDTKTIANAIDMPIDKVNEASQNLENKHLAHIDHRTMEAGKVKDAVVHITAEGIQYLQKEHGIPL